MCLDGELVAAFAWCLLPLYLSFFDSLLPAILSPFFILCLTLSLPSSSLPSLLSARFMVSKYYLP